MTTGRRAGHSATRPAGQVRALDRADHRRLHRRPLPDLLRGVRPADADAGLRPVGQRQRLARHRRPDRELLAVLPPDVPREHQGGRRGASGTCWA